MKLSHDDKLRALKARDAMPTSAETPTKPEGVSEPAVQLSRAMIDDAILRSAATPTARHLIAARHGKPSRQALLPPGRVATFLRTARQLQRLPSFSNRRE